MMPVLKAWRDLRAMGVRALLIVAVIGAGPGTAAGISLALHQVHHARDRFYSRYHLANLDVRLRRPLPPAALTARARAAGARRIETRLILSGEALLPGAEPAAEVVGMDPHASLNQLAVTAGAGLTGASGAGAVLDASFAEHYGLHPGQRLTVALAGRRIALAIRGLARGPEFLMATSNPDYLVPQRGSLAVVFMAREALARLTGMGGGVNDLAVDLPGGGASARANALTAGLPAARIIPRSEQYGLRMTNADIHSFSIFAPVMGVVFALVGVLLIALSLRRLVISQRRELGALLALGYPPRVVVATVLLPAAWLALAGALLAIAITIGVGWLVADQYSNAVGFPAIEHPLAAAPLQLAAGLAIAATLIAALLPAYRLARLDPTQAMRGESVGSFALPAWLQGATAHGGPALTYALRGLLRRPLLTAATVISIAGAVGLAAALNILVSSTNRSVQAEFAHQGWSYSVDLASAMPAGRAVGLAQGAGAARVQPTVEGPARLRQHGGGGADIQLVGLPSRGRLQRLELTSGSLPAPSRIVLSEQTARSLHAALGATLRLSSVAGADEVTVGGIARTLAGQQSYLPSAQAAGLLGIPGRATGLLIAGGPGVAARLRTDPAVARVTSKASGLAAERQLMAELTGLIGVLETISLGVGALFLISTLLLSFLDRRGELATLQALGYGRRQLGAAVVGEAFSQTAIAAVFSIPLGILIASPLAERIAQAWFEIGLHPTPPNFLVVIAPALLVALLVAAHATRRVLRIDIAATVRARLIG
jgi:putative ABC transport system permease protein